MFLISLHRPDLLRSDGIPSTSPHPSPSPLSGSPKVSTPPGKARYRSKQRHRRANSKGSHNDFPGVLKSNSTGIVGSGSGGAASSEEQQPLQQSLQQHHHHHLLLHHHQQHLPLKTRENAVATCANNLRYFGPAAPLRSPQTDHFKRLTSGSNPDLISTAVDADSHRVGSGGGVLEATSTVEDATASPIPAAAAAGLGVSASSLSSSGLGPLCPCCQAHPYPDCPHCQEDAPVPANHPELPHYSLLSTCERSPQPAAPRLGEPVSDTEGLGQEGGRQGGRAEGQGSPRPSLPSGLIRMLRPLRKVSRDYFILLYYFIL